MIITRNSDEVLLVVGEKVSNDVSAVDDTEYFENQVANTLDEHSNTNDTQVGSISESREDCLINALRCWAVSRNVPKSTVTALLRILSPIHRELPSDA